MKFILWLLSIIVSFVTGKRQVSAEERLGRADAVNESLEAGLDGVKKANEAARKVSDVDEEFANDPNNRSTRNPHR